MARIAGVDIPNDKRVVISLTYVYGIGLATSKKILAAAGISEDVRVRDLTSDQEDAIRALAMLKTQMGGGTIKKAERKWNPNVKLNNVEVIEKTTGEKVELVDNEQVLPKSKKRQEIYEKED